MLYLIYIVYFWRQLTLGEKVFTLVWAWDTRHEMTTDWFTHIETAMERAKETAGKAGFDLV